MKRRLTTAAAALLAIVLSLSATAAAGAQPDQPTMLSQILKAPLRGELERPLIGDPQPAIASVEDLLVADDGRVDVIVSVEGNGPNRIIPWSALVYDAVSNDFTMRAKDREPDSFPAWHGPVSETQGTAGKVLASKLLEGLVKTPLGETLGEVKDAQVSRDGVLRQIFFDRGQQTASIAWRGVQVRPELPGIPAAPGTEAVIVIDRKKL